MDNDKKPLEFDDWKQRYQRTFDTKYKDAFERLHGENVETTHEEMLKAEYQNYLDDFNGNWLVR